MKCNILKSWSDKGRSRFNKAISVKIDRTSQRATLQGYTAPKARQIRKRNWRSWPKADHKTLISRSKRIKELSLHLYLAMDRSRQ